MFVSDKKLWGAAAFMAAVLVVDKYDCGRDPMMLFLFVLQIHSHVL